MTCSFVLFSKILLHYSFLLDIYFYVSIRLGNTLNLYWEHKLNFRSTRATRIQKGFASKEVKFVEADSRCCKVVRKCVPS